MPTGPSSSYKITCLPPGAYTTTTYNSSATCAGAGNTTAPTPTLVCAVVASYGGFDVLWEKQTCYAGAYTSPQTGAKVTQYATGNCDTTKAIVDEEVGLASACNAGPRERDVRSPGRGRRGRARERGGLATVRHGRPPHVRAALSRSNEPPR